IALPRNSGAAASRNAGLSLASGSLVGFLDSDDLWETRFLSSLVGLLERYPACGAAFSGHFGVDADGKVFAVSRPDLDGGATAGELKTPFELFVKEFPFITSGTVVRCSVLDQIGWFDETLPLWQDADLWLRIAKQFDFAYTLSPLASYRIHEGNNTN